jgi:D-cysteine desulfhydrase
MVQAFESGLQINHVLCASGSAGTHAGLLVGFFGNNSGIPVTGINVSRNKETQEKIVYGLAKNTAEMAGAHQKIPRDAVTFFN